MHPQKRLMIDLFTRHPATVGETYGAHMRAAFGFAVKLLACGLACLVHAVLPFLFVKTASGTVAQLHHDMVTHRDKRRASSADTSYPERA